MFLNFRSNREVTQTQTTSRAAELPSQFAVTMTKSIAQTELLKNGKVPTQLYSALSVAKTATLKPQATHVSIRGGKVRPYQTILIARHIISSQRGLCGSSTLQRLKADTCGDSLCWICRLVRVMPQFNLEKIAHFAHLKMFLFLQALMMVMAHSRRTNFTFSDHTKETLFVLFCSQTGIYKLIPDLPLDDSLREKLVTWLKMLKHNLTKLYEPNVSNSTDKFQECAVHDMMEFDAAHLHSFWRQFSAQCDNRMDVRINSLIALICRHMHDCLREVRGIVPLATSAPCTSSATSAPCTSSATSATQQHDQDDVAPDWPFRTCLPTADALVPSSQWPLYVYAVMRKCIQLCLQGWQLNCDDEHTMWNSFRAHIILLIRQLPNEAHVKNVEMSKLTMPHLSVFSECAMSLVPMEEQLGTLQESTVQVMLEGFHKTQQATKTKRMLQEIENDDELLMTSHLHSDIVSRAPICVKSKSDALPPEQYLQAPSVFE
jgi:hypothetical protein